MQFKGFYVLTFSIKSTRIKKHVISESSVSFSDKKINDKPVNDIWRCTLWLTLNLQKKRVLVNRKKAERNKSIKSAVKTSIKKVEVAIEAKDKEAATVALQNAISTIDKAATKGVYHKNTAARKVSRLSKAVNTLA